MYMYKYLKRYIPVLSVDPVWREVALTSSSTTFLALTAAGPGSTAEQKKA